MNAQGNFRTFLLSISQEITAEKLEQLKFLSEDVPEGKLAEINKAYDLFDELIKKTKISKDNTDFLAKILKGVRLDALSDKVQTFGHDSEDQMNHNAAVLTRRYGLPNKHVPFIGRDSNVDSTANLLTKEDKRMVVILGPPGLGKSAFVTHIGHALYDSNVSVIFVSLRHIVTMDQFCRKILKTIDPECSLSDNVVEQAQNLLTDCNTHTVLILDNCEDMQNSSHSAEFQLFIENVGSLSRKVKLLLGTRNPLSTLQFECHTIHLHRLKDQDSTSLLKELAPEKFKEDEAETLGARCYGIPLLIKVAAARVRNGYKPSKLAKDLKKLYDVLKSRNNRIEEYLIDSNRVFLGSLKREVLLSLVRLSNFSTDFTEEEVCELYKGDWSVMLCCLCENGLLHLEDGYYSLHPLLQTVCQEEHGHMGCNEEGTQAKEEFTLHYLNKLESIQRKFVSPEFLIALKEYEHDRMNIDQAMENALKIPSILGRCINAFNNSVNLLGKVLPSKQCSEIYNRLYGMAAEMKDTRRIAESLVSLGFIHLCDNNHKTFSEEVTERFKSAYKLFKDLKKSKRKGEAFAHCQSKLGLCYIANGDRLKGKSLMQNAVTLRQELGDQVLLAASHCDRAIAARLLDEHSQAITILKEECYPKYKENLGDHPWVATVLLYISDSYKVMGKLKDAIEYNQESLAIRQKTLGNHQDTARSHVHLAELYEQEDLEKALENYRKAAKIQEKVLGVHKETEASYQAIARISEDPEMRERAGSFRDDLNERARLQKQLSVDQSHRASLHMNEQNFKRIMIKTIIIVLTAIVAGLVINLFKS